MSITGRQLVQRVGMVYYVSQEDPPRVKAFYSSAASDGYKRQAEDFPSGGARAKRMFQPSQLFGTEDCRLGVEFRLLVRGVWASVGSQIQNEKVQEWAPR